MSKMKNLTATVNLNMTVEKLNELNKIIERDRAKPIRQEAHAAFLMDYCPVCGEGLIREANFCHMCGQRVDRETIAL